MSHHSATFYSGAFVIDVKMTFPRLGMFIKYAPDGTQATVLWNDGELQDDVNVVDIAIKPEDYDPLDYLNKEGRATKGSYNLLREYVKELIVSLGRRVLR